MNVVGSCWSAGGRTNNYFKVTQYIASTEVAFLSTTHTMFFFFNDKDRMSTTQAIAVAGKCLDLIASLTSGRCVQMSVFRRVEQKRTVAQIGECVPLPTVKRD